MIALEDGIQCIKYLETGVLNAPPGLNLKQTTMRCCLFHPLRPTE